MYKNKTEKNKNLYFFTKKLLPIMSELFKLQQLVAGYCGLGYYVSFSVFYDNSNDNFKIIKVDYCNLIERNIFTEYYKNNNNLCILYRIINWLKEKGSKISQDESAYFLNAVRFTSENPEFIVKGYHHNPYDAATVDNNLTFNDCNITNIRQHIINKGCHIHDIIPV